jgi:hypothetical protein
MSKNSKFLVVAAIALLTVSGCGKENPAKHIISQDQFEDVLRFIGNPKNIQLFNIVRGKAGLFQTMESVPGPLYNSVADMNFNRNLRDNLGGVKLNGKVEADAKFTDVTIKSCTTGPAKDKPDTENIKCDFTYFPTDSDNKKFPMKNAKIEMLREKGGKINVVKFNE